MSKERPKEEDSDGVENAGICAIQQRSHDCKSIVFYDSEPGNLLVDEDTIGERERESHSPDGQIG